MKKSEPSMTAKICAFARAHHSRQAIENIYDDYKAYDLLGSDEYRAVKKMIVCELNERSWQIPEMSSWDEFLDELISPIVLPRVKYAENQLLEFAARNETVQYIICGAGLDTFAFRNKADNIQIFELDHPNTQNYKLERISKLGWKIPQNIHYVSIDFEKDSLKEELKKAGLRTDMKTFCSIMGVSYYLTLQDLSKTIKSLAEISVQGSQIVLDYPVSGTTEYGKERMLVLKDITNGLGEEMKGKYGKKEIAKESDKFRYKTVMHLDSEDIQKILIGKTKLKAYENIELILLEKY